MHRLLIFLIPLIPLISSKSFAQPLIERFLDKHLRNEDSSIEERTISAAAK